ncbi:MAG: C25 family cysteine peptidase, partial [Planctomycetota bacterium]|nr:C25 family cysteine peptidase [Planctomycetota bacterium]
MADEERLRTAPANGGARLSSATSCMLSARLALLAVSHWLLPEPLLAAPRSHVDTVVVCHPSWQAELTPWLKLRREQGHVIEVIDPAPQVAAVRQQIQAIHQVSQLMHVVLIGNTRCNEGIPTGRIATDSAPQWQVEFASDSVYAELTDDDTPDVAVGRITAQDRQQLREILDRVVRYETSAAAGPWQQRVEIVGGLGGFGPIIDTAVEKSVQTLLVHGVPTSYRIGMTYASWKSPYCPCLQHFQQQVMQRYNSGCLFWVYAGHGHIQELDRVRDTPILGSHTIHQLQADGHAPVAALFSCNAGRFGENYECLAESMLRTSGGPVAVIASAGISMPYGNISLANGLVGHLFAKRGATLGECLLQAQQELTLPDVPSRQWIDKIAAMLGTDAASQQQERTEHMKLYQLFGDPLLRLRFPDMAQVEVPTTATAGETVQVQFESPQTGRGTIELVCPRGRFRSTPHARTTQELKSAELQLAWDRDYVTANTDTWCQIEKSFAPGTTKLDLPIPLNAQGACQVRVFLTDKTNSVQASAPIYIRQA